MQNTSDLNWPHLRNLERATASSGDDSLIAQKARTSLAFIYDQMAQPDNFPILSQKWSAFAAQSINDALSEAWKTPRIARALSINPDEQEVEGLFILGLGKLGGGDLNYSSDVDLVAFFDPERLPTLPHEGKTDVCDRVLKEMTKRLSGRTDADRIWRVDWRLRPDPSVTGLSISVPAGLEFFAFKSAPWRRLAMMKAAVVAGDHIAGEDFLRRLSRFVWRRGLDFRALDEIADIKERIKNEHPGLGATGPAATDITVSDGFHTKLGSGGIREIEFIVNAQQLIWGGRQLDLRTTNTLEALEATARHNHIDPALAAPLRDAYIFLRRLENATQMIRDNQTHVLPDDKEDRDVILHIMGLSKWSDLTNQLCRHRKMVSDAFQKSLHHDQDAAEDVPIALNDLSEALNVSPESEAIIETWQAGFIVQGATPDQATALHGLERHLLVIATEQPDADEAIQTIDKFLRSQARGGQYLRMLASEKTLTHNVISALLRSTPAASLLAQSPHVVDLLLERGGSTEQVEQSSEEILKQTESLADDEAKLEWVRAWTNEQLFLAYVAVLRGEVGTAEAAIRISAIARQAVDICIKLTMGFMDLQHPPLSALGLGRLGMNDMHPLSDLDLIFLANEAGKGGQSGADVETDPAALDLANRFSLRLKTTLGAQMRAGRVWEIDTRLRPSGQSGPPTLRPSSFQTHQLERAKTWEHIALVPSCMVSGSQRAMEVFRHTRQAVIELNRDPDQLLCDAASMLSLLREKRIPPKPGFAYEVKLVRGGLMEAEFLINTLTLKHGPATPELAHASYRDLPGALATIDSALEGLAEAHRTLSDMQFQLRLLGDDRIDRAEDLPSWKNRRQEATKLVSKLLQGQIFKPAKALGFDADDYREVTVRRA
jgi:glutamate-ammonia-ligase adenylyltransferase